ncbi:hypothetical protein LRR80_01096 [Streptomyces sp. RO-S4]|uniref:DUF6183 family protein n=2 Tax=Streptomyces TaxID=1883 RepID=UPI002096626A|nr:MULTISPECIES: DUF6183 family protein [unclassified Streptomyces]MCO4695048.1 hypothetical protein [Streptomyces sp. RO-S4]
MSHDHLTPGDDAFDPRRWEEAGPEELTRLAEQRPEELYEAAVRLCRGAPGGEFGGTPQTRTAGRIAEVLADTRSRDCAAYAVDIVGRLPPQGAAARQERDRLRRSVAERLAKAQPPRHLEPLFVALPDDPHDPETETRACILGELALTGAGTGRRVLDAYTARLRELGHPLTRLPGTRLDVEHRFTVRVRGLGPVKTPQQLRARFPEMPPSDRGAVVGRGAAGVPDDGRAQAAVRPFTAGGWEGGSEARFFMLPEPLDPDAFGMSLLEELPLDCLTVGNGRQGTALACATTPDDVLNELFSAAYYGGVNGQGQGRAYARLYAWDSLYALMGLSVDVPFLEAVRVAADHRWLRFMAFTGWFHHDAADVAFAVLDPTRTRVAVLAATDTDQDAPG